MKKRCSYCGKVIEKYKTFCNIQCKNNYDEFEKYTNKRAGLVTIIIAIALVIAFIGMILTAVNEQLGVTVILGGCLGLFIILAIFPFATPETVKLIGVRKSTVIVRVLASAMILYFVFVFVKFWLSL